MASVTTGRTNAALPPELRRLTFHCPGDVFFAVYRQPALRPLFDVLRGIATAHSMCEEAAVGGALLAATTSNT